VSRPAGRLDLRSLCEKMASKIEAVRQGHDRLATIYDRRWRAYGEVTQYAAVEGVDFGGHERSISVRGQHIATTTVRASVRNTDVSFSRDARSGGHIDRGRLTCPIHDLPPPWEVDQAPEVLYGESTMLLLGAP
jgi:hypothetical protein